MAPASRSFMTCLLLAGACAPALARDLTLAEAQDLLIRNNRELQASRRAIESAESQQSIAGVRPNPTLSLNMTQIGAYSNMSSGPFTQARSDSVLRIDQPFERGDKREIRLDAAARLQQAAQHDSLDVLRLQTALLQSAYFDLKQAQEKSQVMAETAQLFSGTLAAAQARLKAGDLAPADVARVQVDYERGQNDARNALAELLRAQISLAYMIGA